MDALFAAGSVVRWVWTCMMGEDRAATRIPEPPYQVERLEAVGQSPVHHPEGNALFHSLQVFEQARRSSREPAHWAAALLHDLGKAVVSQCHAAAGADMLDGIANRHVQWLVAHHLDLLRDPKLTRITLALDPRLRDLERLRAWDLAGRRSMRWCLRSNAPLAYCSSRVSQKRGSRHRSSRNEPSSRATAKRRARKLDNLSPSPLPSDSMSCSTLQRSVRITPLRAPRDVGTSVDAYHYVCTFIPRRGALLAHARAMSSLSPRLAAIVDALPLRPGMRVLEIGCGPGVAAREVARRLRGGHVLAIDRSKKAIALARAGSKAELASGQLSFRCVAIEDFELASDEAPFDLAFAIRVGALDGRHPDAFERACARIGAALTPRAKLHRRRRPAAADHLVARTPDEPRSFDMTPGASDAGVRGAVRPRAERACEPRYPAVRCAASSSGARMTTDHARSAAVTQAEGYSGATAAFPSRSASRGGHRSRRRAFAPCPTLDRIR